MKPLTVLLLCLLCGIPAFADFRLDVGGAKYEVVVGEPAVKEGKLPLVIYHHGHGKGGLQKYALENLAKRFAQEGYLFWAPKRQAGGILPEAMAVGKAILSKGQEDPRVDGERIAVIGFSQGSVVAFLTGVHNPRVRAVCVLGFGSEGKAFGQIQATPFESVKAAVLIQEGESDDQVSPAAYRSVEKSLRDAGKTVRLITYSGCRHDDLCGEKAYLKDLFVFLKETMAASAK